MIWSLTFQNIRMFFCCGTYWFYKLSYCQRNWTNTGRLFCPRQQENFGYRGWSRWTADQGQLHPDTHSALVVRYFQIYPTCPQLPHQLTGKRKLRHPGSILYPFTKCVRRGPIQRKGGVYRLLQRWGTHCEQSSVVSSLGLYAGFHVWLKNPI
jgi:hypothetical protein